MRLILLGSVALLVNVYPKEAFESLINFISASIFTLILCSLARDRFYKLPFFLTISLSAAQYWIFSTINTFTNFGTLYSSLLFFGFVFVNFISFMLLRFFIQILSNLGSFGLALSVGLWEALPLQLFRWKIVYLFSSFSFIPFGVSVLGSTFFSMCLILLFDNVVKKRIRLFTLTAFGIFLLELIGRFHPSFDNLGLLKFKIIQPNHSLKEKNSPDLIPYLIEDFKDLLEKNKNYDFLILPESVFYHFVSSDIKNIELDPVYSKIFYAKNLIVGALTTDGGKFFNSILFVTNTGDVAGIYSKKILMPFGEYFPLRGKLQSILKFHPIEDFTQGTYEEPFVLDGLRFAGFICYEDLFESYVKKRSKKADLIVVVSNDLWFGRTIAPYLHDRFSRFRSIELGRILVRVSNSGYSSIVNPDYSKKITLPPNEKISAVVELNVLRRNTLYSHLPVYTELVFLICVSVLAIFKNFIVSFSMFTNRYGGHSY